MYDNYIELKIEGLTRGRELQNAFILVLREVEGERFFPVLIDQKGYEMIAAALSEKDFTCSHLMNQLASRVGMTLIGVRLMQPANGETRALIDFELVNETVSIQTPVAEAAVAAHEMRASLWVQSDIFERQSKVQPTGQSMALPITAMNNELLEAALQGAVEEENFELASILRDELKKRTSRKDNEQL